MTQDDDEKEIDSATVTTSIGAERPTTQSGGDETIYVSCDPDDPDSQVPIQFAHAFGGVKTQGETPTSAPEPAPRSTAGRDPQAPRPALPPAESDEERLSAALTAARVGFEQALAFAEQQGTGQARGGPGSSFTARRNDQLRARRSARHENAKDGQTKTVERPIVDIPLSEIRGTRIPNIRQQEHGVDYVSLRDSLARDGQLHAISVVPDGAGHFLCVTGSQRFHAATELGWS